MDARKNVAALSALALLTGLLGGTTTGAAAAPPGCEAPVNTSFANTTPATIPMDLGTGLTTSTLTVANAGPVLSDLDLFTDISHSYNEDIEMTLESPSGTSVTMTTGNGGANGDVFAGTTWDDDADPGNQVPYSSVPVNIVTDHVFTDGVTVPRLVPEEAMSAFRGEDPNGQWTLAIRDTRPATDDGVLNSWSLALATRTTQEDHEAAPRFVFETRNPISAGHNTGQMVPVGGVVSRISDISVGLKAPHTNSEDLEISLTSPAGTSTTLTTGNGNGADNFADTVFDDRAGSPTIVTDYPFAPNVTPEQLVPEEAMGAFVGENPNGDWYLSVLDANDNGLDGYLDSWSLTITPSVCDDEVLGLRAKVNRHLVKRWFIQAKIRVEEPAWIQVTGKAKAKGKSKRFFQVRKQVRRSTPGYEQWFQMRLHPKVYRQMQRTYDGWAKLNIKVTDTAGNIQRIKKSVRIQRKW